MVCKGLNKNREFREDQSSVTDIIPSTAHRVTQPPKKATYGNFDIVHIHPI